MAQNTAAGTIGGGIVGFITALTTKAFFLTAGMTIFAAVLSFFTSLFLKWLVERYKKRNKIKELKQNWKK